MAEPNPYGANGTTSDPREQKMCLICGYSKHLERAHIIPKSLLRYIDGYQEYSKFDNDNIVLLCKNHHWEYDHDLIDDEDYRKITEEVIRRKEFLPKYTFFICGKVEETGNEYMQSKLKLVNSWIIKTRSKLDKLGFLKDIL